MRKLIATAVLLIVATPPPLFSGPPFLTDDPEPVGFHHWEFYVSSIQTFSRAETDATLPHIEINYGIVPAVQLHLILPMEYVSQGGLSNYGFSDTEFGVKYRFIDETADMPQVGTFPLVEIPTANTSQNLGNGAVQFYLPLWIQKSWEKFTTYGGGGWWYNAGIEKKNWLFLGWEAQYDLSRKLTLGGEAYFHTATDEGGRSDAGFNIGGILNFDQTNHILFSIGHNVLDIGTFTGYIGYQMTI